MLGKIEGRRRRVTEDEMVGWHHRLKGREFEQTPGDSEGQGSLACCLRGVAKSWTRLSKFRLKLKKVGKTTRPFRYDLIKSPMIIQWK